ncbi:hypothetical protein V9T40_014134 [Parthenolecanium corni]|uniref:Integrase catalytic domain-containing protein n=1 Tax=Parthenolecanium corni TaxID=536013 RepID=A0AAN9TTC2_9HEMI
MEALNKERCYQMLSLTRLKASMEEQLKQKTISLELVAKMESTLDDHYRPELKQFTETTQKALMLLSDKEDAKEDQELEIVMLDDINRYRDISIVFQSKIKSYQAKLSDDRVCKSIVPPTSASEPSSSIVHQFAKMKEIEPPTFNGDLTKFFEWKNLFVNLIHNRPPNEMGNTLKLYYLKKSMVGEVEGLLTDFNLSDEGYVSAWDFVLFRFEKRRSIVKAFFRKLQHLEPIKNEQNLQKLLDSTNSVIRGSTAAGEEINDTFSRFLAFHTSTKLDAANFKDWEDLLSSTDTYLKFEQLSKFLQCRARELRRKNQESPPPPQDRDCKSFLSTVVRKPKCVLCAQNHYLNQCVDFKAKSPQDRYEIVKKNQLCLICFESRHGISDCKSKFVCNCGSRHSSLLHFEFKKSYADKSVPSEKSSSSAQNSSESRSVKKQSYLCLRNSPNKFVILPSAIIRFSCNGVVGKARVLLDSCSQPTLVSNLFVRKFKFAVQRSQPSSISGVGKNSINSSSFSIAYTANFAVPAQLSADIRKYPLADPAWAHERLAIDRVDMIIDGKFYEQIICDESYWVGELKLRRTQFCYTVAGVAPQSIGIDRTLRRFWELEEASYQPSLQAQESAAFIKHFEENTSFAEDNKFVSKLPFQIDRDKIAPNREHALASFYHLKRSLDEETWAVCVKFLIEYREAGHMSLAAPPKNHAYYIPYRPVIREQSSTTPVRVVFNASSHRKGELSLNDGLMRDPVIQRDLFDILISMRSYRFVLCADIKQMYRMVWVHPDDRDMQRIFFRESPSEPVQEYCLKTVTYGTKPASFIATKCLDEVSKELEESNPLAAQTIRDCFYMDDLIAGGNLFGEVLSLQKLVHTALAKRGFQLRKYLSNSKELLEKIPHELLAETALKTFEEEGYNQVVLGVTWNPSTDAYGVHCNIDSVFNDIVVTKRIVLSYMSRIFDPMGLVSPVTIQVAIVVAGGKVILPLYCVGYRNLPKTGERIECLQQSLPVKNKSSLVSLNPFLDGDGVMRVGGRLDRSEFLDDKKHPIILPAKSHFARILCRHVHEKYFHAGRLFLASIFSSQYWFVGGCTNLFKFVIRSCVSCAKVCAKTSEQLMGQLPLAKVSVSRPFAHCGVDFAGPFTCKCTGHRSTKFGKIYIAVFVCLAVRAVHIEIVSDLSTPKFIESLQRFIARRGIPVAMYSDNGTNFVGTKNFFALDRDKLIEFSTTERFNWVFIPSKAPNFGGTWEAAVKSAKKHLMNVTHCVTLSFEEYGTLLTRIEAVLNSRPICYKDVPVQGSEALTPAHFLIGRPMYSIPHIDDEQISLTNRLLLIQNQVRGFWTSWSKDYINQMRQLSKWRQEEPNLVPGQIVLV